MKSETNLKRRDPKPETDMEKHYRMSRVHTKNTCIELQLRKALWHKGIRYRVNYAVLPGKPDIVITKSRIAIFCDGEFWHGKDWATSKKKLHTNREFWISKIEKTKQRDAAIDKELQSLGWQVIRFWGKDIEKRIDECVECVQDAILQDIVQKSTMMEENKKYSD